MLLYTLSRLVSVAFNVPSSLQRITKTCTIIQGRNEFKGGNSLTNRETEDTGTSKEDNTKWHQTVMKLNAWKEASGS